MDALRAQLTGAQWLAQLANAASYAQNANQNAAADDDELEEPVPAPSYDATSVSAALGPALPAYLDCRATREHEDAEYAQTVAFIRSLSTANNRFHEITHDRPREITGSLKNDGIVPAYYFSKQFTFNSIDHFGAASTSFDETVKLLDDVQRHHALVTRAFTRLLCQRHPRLSVAATAAAPINEEVKVALSYCAKVRNPLAQIMHLTKVPVSLVSLCRRRTGVYKITEVLQLILDCWRTSETLEAIAAAGKDFTAILTAVDAVEAACDTHPILSQLLVAQSIKRKISSITNSLSKESYIQCGRLIKDYIRSVAHRAFMECFLTGQAKTGQCCQDFSSPFRKRRRTVPLEQFAHSIYSQSHVADAASAMLKKSRSSFILRETIDRCRFPERWSQAISTIDWEEYDTSSTREAKGEALAEILCTIYRLTRGHHTAEITQPMNAQPAAQAARFMEEDLLRALGTIINHFFEPTRFGECLQTIVPFVGPEFKSFLTEEVSHMVRRNDCVSHHGTIAAPTARRSNDMMPLVLQSQSDMEATAWCCANATAHGFSEVIFVIVTCLCSREVRELDRALKNTANKLMNHLTRQRSRKTDCMRSPQTGESSSPPAVASTPESSGIQIDNTPEADFDNPVDVFDLEAFMDEWSSQKRSATETGEHLGLTAVQNISSLMTTLERALAECLKVCYTSINDLIVRDVALLNDPLDSELPKNGFEASSPMENRNEGTVPVILSQLNNVRNVSHDVLSALGYSQSIEKYLERMMHGLLGTTIHLLEAAVTSFSNNISLILFKAYDSMLQHANKDVAADVAEARNTNWSNVLLRSTVAGGMSNILPGRVVESLLDNTGENDRENAANSKAFHCGLGNQSEGNGASMKAVVNGSYSITASQSVATSKVSAIAEHEWPGNSRKFSIPLKFCFQLGTIATVKKIYELMCVEKVEKILAERLPQQVEIIQLALEFDAKNQACLNRAIEDTFLLAAECCSASIQAASFYTTLLRKLLFLAPAPTLTESGLHRLVLSLCTTISSSIDPKENELRNSRRTKSLPHFDCVNFITASAATNRGIPNEPIFSSPIERFLRRPGNNKTKHLQLHSYILLMYVLEGVCLAHYLPFAIPAVAHQIHNLIKSFEKLINAFIEGFLNTTRNLSYKVHVVQSTVFSMELLKHNLRLARPIFVSGSTHEEAAIPGFPTVVFGRSNAVASVQTDGTTSIMQELDFCQEKILKLLGSLIASKFNPAMIQRWLAEEYEPISDLGQRYLILQRSRLKLGHSALLPGGSEAACNRTITLLVKKVLRPHRIMCDLRKELHRAIRGIVYLLPPRKIAVVIKHAVLDVVNTVGEVFTSQAPAILVATLLAVSPPKPPAAEFGNSVEAKPGNTAEMPAAGSYDGQPSAVGMDGTSRRHIQASSPTSEDGSAILNSATVKLLLSETVANARNLAQRNLQQIKKYSSKKSATGEAIYGSIAEAATTPTIAGAITPATTPAVTPAIAGAVTPAIAGAVTPAIAGAVTPAIAGAVTPAIAGAVTPAIAAAITVSTKSNATVETAASGSINLFLPCSSNGETTHERPRVTAPSISATTPGESRKDFGLSTKFFGELLTTAKTSERILRSAARSLHKRAQTMSANTFSVEKPEEVYPELEPPCPDQASTLNSDVPKLAHVNAIEKGSLAKTEKCETVLKSTDVLKALLNDISDNATVTSVKASERMLERTPSFDILTFLNDFADTDLEISGNTAENSAPLENVVGLNIGESPLVPIPPPVSASVPPSDEANVPRQNHEVHLQETVMTCPGPAFAGVLEDIGNSEPSFDRYDTEVEAVRPSEMPLDTSEVPFMGPMSPGLRTSPVMFYPHKETNFAPDCRVLSQPENNERLQGIPEDTPRPLSENQKPSTEVCAVAADSNSINDGILNVVITPAKSNFLEPNLRVPQGSEQSLQDVKSQDVHVKERTGAAAATVEFVPIEDSEHPEKHREIVDADHPVVTSSDVLLTSSSDIEGNGASAELNQNSPGGGVRLRNAFLDFWSSSSIPKEPRNNGDCVTPDESRLARLTRLSRMLGDLLWLFYALSGPLKPGTERNSSSPETLTPNSRRGSVQRSGALDILDASLRCNLAQELGPVFNDFAGLLLRTQYLDGPENNSGKAVMTALFNSMLAWDLNSGKLLSLADIAALPACDPGFKKSGINEVIARAAAITFVSSFELGGSESNFLTEYE